MKDINAVIGPIKAAMGFAALALAVAAVAKLSGFVSIRYGITELAVVGILCALASR
jgi:hypothetical protein